MAAVEETNPATTGERTYTVIPPVNVNAALITVPVFSAEEKPAPVKLFKPIFITLLILLYYVMMLTHVPADVPVLVQGLVHFVFFAILAYRILNLIGTFLEHRARKWKIKLQEAERDLAETTFIAHEFGPLIISYYNMPMMSFDDMEALYRGEVVNLLKYKLPIDVQVKKEETGEINLVIVD